ncbi:hypothetical protein NDU88_003735 [Pleurodeles waltl]|uniref:Uncharacterized protein n=1 Tax=Pleurodeles waltl TaxID=8319 RepID=A0AAV7W5H6_PLEWA|nr:hypothetical protein NDU88_003735 [Pleurodeles waltl]
MVIQDDGWLFRLIQISLPVPSRLVVVATAAPTLPSHMPCDRILDSLGGVAAFLGRCGKLCCGESRAQCSLARGQSSFSGVAAALSPVYRQLRRLRRHSSWRLVFNGAESTIRTPRMLRRKPSLEVIGAKREKKQPAPPLKDQTGA